ncbi:hypothetical protein Hamer_G008473 [Homarus americanus]|uniref:Uncharacterized protein n=1 Tax=Homarus americanus TaxID=6706 RepID=A0A8J5N471_HOMAM|nr:hypothetical protein Hamer_G008473 [Homarus americanus]
MTPHVQVWFVNGPMCPDRLSTELVAADALGESVNKYKAAAHCFPLSQSWHTSMTANWCSVYLPSLTLCPDMPP